MASYTERDRSRWFQWQEKNGTSVAETCRHFGIARSTYYFWARRRNPIKPTASLKRRRPKRVRPQEAMFLGKVIDLSFRHPRWGARRLREELQPLRDDVPSEATIGRWLRVIAAGCPVCQQKGGRHQAAMHALRHDLLMGDIAPVIRANRKPDLTRPGAVDAAARIVSRARRGDGGQ